MVRGPLVRPASRATLCALAIRCAHQVTDFRAINGDPVQIRTIYRVETLLAERDLDAEQSESLTQKQSP